jgi:hypothetical protein
MKAETQTLDVAVLLEAIRAEVRARQQALPAAAPQTQALARQLQQCAEQLEITRVVSAHWPLESASFPQRVVNFGNKIVRRLLCWYINPIVEQQNAFNDVSTRTLLLLIEGYQELHQRTNALETIEKPEQPQYNDEITFPPYLPPASETLLLQQLIEEQGRKESPAALADLNLRPCVAQLTLRQKVNAHWPLVGNFIAIRVQKLIRRYLRWLVNPLVEQQNDFNVAFTQAISPLITVDAEIRAEIAALRAKARSKNR